MALTIKNSETERLAAEVAELAGETEAEAVRNALRERKLRLAPRLEPSPGDRAQRVDLFWKHLEEKVWPRIPVELRGKGISKEEKEEILGYGPEGA